MLQYLFTHTREKIVLVSNYTQVCEIKVGSSSGSPPSSNDLTPVTWISIESKVKSSLKGESLWMMLKSNHKVGKHSFKKKCRAGFNPMISSLPGRKAAQLAGNNWISMHVNSKIWSLYILGGTYIRTYRLRRELQIQMCIVHLHNNVWVHVCAQITLIVPSLQTNLLNSSFRRWTYWRGCVVHVATGVWDWTAPPPPARDSS